MAITFKEGVPDVINPLTNLPYVYYFASPYSSPHPFIREQRYLQALVAAGELHERGYALIEPIGMSHHTAKVSNLPTTYEHWKARDRAFILSSRGVIVLMIDGWLESTGVTDELLFAFSQNKPVFVYITNLKGNSELHELDKDSYLAFQQSKENPPAAS